MADIQATVSNLDPVYQEHLLDIEQMLMFDDNPSLDLPVFDVPSSTGPDSLIVLSNQSNDDNIMDMDDPVADPFILEFLNDPPNSDDNSGDGTSEIRIETDGQNSNSPNPGFGNPVPLAVWPIPPVPYSCSFCQVLRDITHRNGFHTTKLEIHGRVGLISHAILTIGKDTDLTTQCEEYQMFDFSQESTTCVKQFLVQYCEGRKQAGFTLMQDPLSIFYEAMCVGLTEDGNSSGTNEFPQHSQVDSGDIQMNQLEVVTQPEFVNLPFTQVAQPELVNQHLARSEQATLAKPPLAVQRERTRNLTLEDLRPYFHFPIEEASKRINLCPTVIKKICRKAGLARWPYRKVKSMKGKIEKRTENLTTASDATERAQAQVDIGRLQQGLTTIFAG